MHSTSRVVGVSKLLIGCCALAACNADFSGLSSSTPTVAGASDPQFPGGPAGPLLDAKAVSAKSAAPVVGGTLLVTRDGKTIAAADPERDTVFLVNAASHAVTQVPLQAGDEPGRVAEGADGTLYVALRRGGALVALDVASGSIARRAAVCASPRGIAYDAKSASVYVACRSGLLLTLDSNDLSVQRSITLDPDLRDVLVREQDLVVTRYLSAEVLVVAADGSVSRRATPQPAPGCGTATVLSRALALPGGEIALAHQISSDDTVDVNNGGYGFSSCGGGLVTRTVSKVNVDVASDTPVASNFGVTSNTVEYVHSAMTFQSLIVPSAGPLDIAVDAASGQLAVIALDSSLQATSGGKIGAGPSVGSPLGPAVLLSSTLGASLWLAPLSGAASPGNVTTASLAVAIKGQPVAVAFNAGSYIVQSREPASLEFQDGTSVALSTESHADTGHFMFHMDTGIGISCSSCHPEGGEDGHVWHFPSGLRRTLPLEGGVMERAPFHWDGMLADMKALFSEVMVKRMNLQATVSDPQVAALGAFLEQLPELAPTDGLDYAAVGRGEALFRRTDVGCAVCHDGAQYTNNALSDVGTGGQFVTPSLLGVGLRSPIFHDGCAKSVAERFGPCGGSEHGKASLLSADEQADLIAFLRSL
jgi:hypothetical protein